MIKADTFLYLSRADIEVLALSFRKNKFSDWAACLHRSLTACALGWGHPLPLGWDPFRGWAEKEKGGVGRSVCLGSFK